MAARGTAKLGLLADCDMNSQYYDSQDLFAGETDNVLEDALSNFPPNGASRDVMLNAGLSLEMPTNWTPATGADVSLSQLLGTGLTESDLETFPFGQVSDSDGTGTFSQVLTNDLIHVNPLGSTGNGLGELVAAEPSTSIIHSRAMAIVESTVEYRQPPTPTPSAVTTTSSNSDLARRKIFNDDIITLEDWRGQLNFNVTPEIDPTLAKKNLYLKEENKLFCKMGIAIPFKIELDFGKIKDANDFLIRASLFFTDPNDVNKPVLRCSSHVVEEGRLEGETNNYRLSHILRPSQPLKDTAYFNEPSERCYLLTNLKFPEPGTTSLNRSYVFTCLSSCKGDKGINRRPICMMFCLFNKQGKICGRRVIKVRVCSAPLRDYQKEKSECGAHLMSRKRKSSSGTQFSEVTKRAINNNVQATSPGSPGGVRCIVTAGKKKAVEEDHVSSSQETVYSCAESDHRIPLRQLIRDIRWALSQKRSSDVALQGYARNVYSSLRMTQDLCDSARDYENALLQRNKGKEEKSPDGGFHEGGQD